mgnify:CR=1 FL=1
MSTQSHIVDAYIRDRLQRNGFMPRFKNIEPSRDFMRVTLSRIDERRRRLALLNAAILTGAAIIPLASQEAWLHIRNNFVSVSSLPFNHGVSTLYQYFIHPMCTLVLTILPVGITLFMLTRYVVLPKVRELRLRRSVITS